MIETVRLYIKGGTVLLDSDKLHLVDSRRWYVKLGYAVHTVNDRSTGRHRATTELMHRLLIGASPGQMVDHINRNRLDNRLCNLRICTVQENCQNRAGGNGQLITRHPCGRWQSTVEKDGRPYYLGLYVDADDAAAVSRYAWHWLREKSEPLPDRTTLRHLVLGGTP